MVAEMIQGSSSHASQTLQGTEQETERYPFEEHLADYNNLNLVDDIKPSGAVLTGVSLLFFNVTCRMHRWRDQ